LKLGIFGGTFNPIHNGHLINAEIIRSEYHLDRILLVPSKIPVHKDLAGNVSAEERYTMTLLAVQDVKEFEVSKIEIDREGPSYTIDTLRELRLIYPDDSFYLILGMDSLYEIGKWKETELLLGSVPVIVMKRPGMEKIHVMDFDTCDIMYADNPMIEISSSCVRERLRNKRSVRFLIPDQVIEYINKKGLYSR
jgi:nicotinate-nucleotide adenylyltransferase